MQFPESLYSIRSESSVIGGLINHPQVLIELSPHLSEDDFIHKVHKVIFSILRAEILKGAKINKVLLAQKCKELGFNTFEDLNLFDYVDSVSFTKINKDGIVGLAKELIKLRIKRELWNSTCEAIFY